MDQLQKPQREQNRKIGITEDIARSIFLYILRNGAKSDINTRCANLPNARTGENVVSCDNAHSYKQARRDDVDLHDVANENIADLNDERSLDNEILSSSKVCPQAVKEGNLKNNNLHHFFTNLISAGRKGRNVISDVEIEFVNSPRVAATKDVNSNGNAKLNAKLDSASSPDKLTRENANFNSNEPTGKNANSSYEHATQNMNYFDEPISENPNSPPAEPTGEVTNYLDEPTDKERNSDEPTSTHVSWCSDGTRSNNSNDVCDDYFKSCTTASDGNVNLKDSCSDNIITYSALINGIIHVLHAPIGGKVNLFHSPTGGNVHLYYADNNDNVNLYHLTCGNYVHSYDAGSRTLACLSNMTNDSLTNRHYQPTTEFENRNRAYSMIPNTLKENGHVSNSNVKSEFSEIKRVVVEDEIQSSLNILKDGDTEQIYEDDTILVSKQLEDLNLGACKSQASTETENLDDLRHLPKTRGKLSRRNRRNRSEIKNEIREIDDRLVDYVEEHNYIINEILLAEEGNSHKVKYNIDIGSDKSDPPLSYGTRCADIKPVSHELPFNEVNILNQNINDELVADKISQDMRNLLQPNQFRSACDTHDSGQGGVNQSGFITCLQSVAQSYKPANDTLQSNEIKLPSFAHINDELKGPFKASEINSSISLKTSPTYSYLCPIASPGEISATKIQVKDQFPESNLYSNERPQREISAYNLPDVSNSDPTINGYKTFGTFTQGNVENYIPRIPSQDNFLNYSSNIGRTTGSTDTSTTGMHHDFSTFPYNYPRKIPPQNVCNESRDFQQNTHPGNIAALHQSLSYLQPFIVGAVTSLLQNLNFQEPHAGYLQHVVNQYIDSRSYLDPKVEAYQQYLPSLPVKTQIQNLYLHPPQNIQPQQSIQNDRRRVII